MILEPKSSFGRTDDPHSSQSTTASDENGAPQPLQRRSISPPHCGQVSGSSASNSSNQRRAAPQLETECNPVAEDLPTLFPKPIRRLAHALTIAVVLAAIAACGADARYNSTRGARLVDFTLHSRFTRRNLHEVLVVPRRHGNWMLVLLHGKGGSPSQFLSQPFFDTLAKLGARAPDVLLLDGGDDSYWHNRADGRWGSMVMREAIPAGLQRTHARRVAIGGISMGGYGALLLGSRNPRAFCASARSRLRSGSVPERRPRARSTTRRTTRVTTSSSSARRIRSGSTSARAIRSGLPRSPTRGERTCKPI